LNRPLTLGTAGHIDHGKTALIGVLTGVATDRLPEERKRGISIELGYAPLELPSGRVVSVVDVPGHERFVRTMVAGATGIDFYLMVIAADDGVMPQTREHAAVLAALGVDVGVVAITKTDLAEPALATEQAAELLPGAEIVAVSARSRSGLGELGAALDRAAGRVTSRAADAGPVCLHVDRAFTIRGAGTVVTGTLWSGVAERGAEVDLLPSGRRGRVRGVQVHDRTVERAHAGQRVALNLGGLAVGDVERGDVVVGGAGAPRATFRADVALEWASDDLRPDHGTRVAVHHGTREAAARIAELGGRYFQLRLEQPIVPAAGDRVVIRALAPPDTLGGGVVLDPAPPRHGPSKELLARLERLRRGEPAETAPAPPAPVRPEPREPPALTPAALAIEAELRASGLTPPLDSELDADAELAALRRAGRIDRLGGRSHAHAETLAAARAAVVALIERDGEVTIASLRDELGVSRKYAQAYLEHADAARITLRVGDRRVLRRRARI
jgi:selenocysteine-specific elongation factor